MAAALGRARNFRPALAMATFLACSMMRRTAQTLWLGRRFARGRGSHPSHCREEPEGRDNRPASQEGARRFKGGADLFRGDWRQLALAGACQRDDALLILDECTAAPGARAGCDVFQCFAELTRSRMAVPVSHCFSTARMVDRIPVLAQGARGEQGTHEELISLGGRYAGHF
jgi:hypothetical protein